MGKIVNFNDINKSEIVRRIKQGDIFIYPTDTIYGIGCNALAEDSVEKIRRIKRRRDKPFSVIAPNKQWISKNFDIVHKNFIKKLPGPYTYILKTRKKLVASSVNLGFKSLGVRLPKHDFVELIKKARVPFVSTSVNFSGGKEAKSIKQIPRRILNSVDIIVDDGFLHNYPSTIIDLTGKIPKIVKR